VAFVVALAACSSTGDSHTSTATGPILTLAPTTPTTATSGGEGSFAEPQAVGDLMVTLTNPTVGSDASGPWLTVAVHAENQSSAGAQPPTFELRCSGSTAGGSWLATSTFKQTEPIEAGASSEGSIDLALPGDDRSGAARQTCATPATIVASALSFGANGAGQPTQAHAEWTVPDDLIAQLNSA
jgi:hypothetical protein